MTGGGGASASCMLPMAHLQRCRRRCCTQHNNPTHHTPHQPYASPPPPHTDIKQAHVWHGARLPRGARQAPQLHHEPLVDRRPRPRRPEGAHHRRRDQPRQARVLGQAERALPPGHGGRREHAQRALRARRAARRRGGRRRVRSAALPRRLCQLHDDARVAQRHVRRVVPPRLFQELRGGRRARGLRQGAQSGRAREQEQPPLPSLQNATCKQHHQPNIMPAHSQTPPCVSTHAPTHTHTHRAPRATTPRRSAALSCCRPS